MWQVGFCFPCLGIKPMCPELKVWNLNYWMARDPGLITPHLDPVNVKFFFHTYVCQPFDKIIDFKVYIFQSSASLFSHILNLIFYYLL